MVSTKRADTTRQDGQVVPKMQKVGQKKDLREQIQNMEAAIKRGEVPGISSTKTNNTGGEKKR